MLEEKTHTITCRLDEADFQKLTKEADAMGVNTSDYIRLLTRLPLECKKIESADAFVVIDPLPLALLSITIKRQGYLLNQAVRALNTIAQRVRHGNAIDEEMCRLMRKANSSLEKFKGDFSTATDGIEAITEKRMLFLDRYRRKPK